MDGRYRLRAWLNRALDALAPCHCALCGLPSGRSLALCEPCEAELPRNSNCCQSCALPLPRSAVACGVCLKRPPAFSAALAPCIYGGPVAALVRDFKYRGDLSRLDILAQLMVDTIAARLEQESGPDCLVPMPLHWWRRWRRGFNQAEMLATALSHHPRLQHWPLPVRRDLCRRSRPTLPQAGLDARARRRNLRRAFHCRYRIDGQYVAIVDDVLTTGASAHALAVALRDAGAARVEVWCCARTPQPSRTSAIPQ